MAAQISTSAITERSAPASAGHDALLLALSDRGLREALAAGLRGQGYYVFAVDSPAAAMRVATQVHLGLAITDSTFPSAASRTLLQWLRTQPFCAQLRSLVLSPVPLDPDWEALDTSILTPLTSEDVFQAVRRALRHIPPPASGTAVTEPLTLNLLTFELRGAARSVVLTPTEFRLLRLLLERRGATVSYEEFVQALWHEHPIGGTALIRVHMRNLRHKLAQAV